MAINACVGNSKFSKVTNRCDTDDKQHVTQKVLYADVAKRAINKGTTDIKSKNNEERNTAEVDNEQRLIK